MSQEIVFIRQLLKNSILLQDSVDQISLGLMFFRKKNIFIKFNYSNRLIDSYLEGIGIYYYSGEGMFGSRRQILLKNCQVE